MPMQPIHRLAHLAQRADGGMEWAGPRCGRYMIPYPNRELVVAAGVLGPSPHPRPRVLGRPHGGPSVSEFDQQFLHRHAMAWSADYRPQPKETP